MAGLITTIITAVMNVYNILKSLQQLRNVKESLAFTGNISNTANITVVCCQYSQLKKMWNLLEVSDVPSKFMDPLKCIQKVSG